VRSGWEFSVVWVKGKWEWLKVEDPKDDVELVASLPVSVSSVLCKGLELAFEDPLRDLFSSCWEGEMRFQEEVELFEEREVLKRRECEGER
jgi:hypothetical protein